MNVIRRVTGIGRRALWPTWVKLNGIFGRAWQLPSGVAPELYNAHAALQFPAVVGCVRLLADRVAALPMVVEAWRPDDKGVPKWQAVDPREDEEAAVVTERWTPLETSGHGRSLLMQAVTLHGMGVVRLEREGARLRGLHILDPETVTRSAVSGAVQYQQGTEVLDRSDLAVVDFMPALDRVENIPPLWPSWQAVRAGIAAQAWVAGYFQDGATGTIMYQWDKPVADTKKPQQDLWDREDRMRRKGKRSLLLPFGVKPFQFSSNIADARIADIVLSAKVAVCDVFDVPSVLLNDPTSSTYNNKGQAAIDFARGTISGWARRIGEELTLAVWPQGGRRVRFDLDQVTSDSRKDRVAASVQLLNAGAVAVDDVREQEGLEPLGGEYALPKKPRPMQIQVQEPDAEEPATEEEDE